MDAGLVGPDGSVVGVDRMRWPGLGCGLESAGLAQARFVEGDIDDPAPGGPFDAIPGAHCFPTASTRC